MCIIYIACILYATLRLCGRWPSKLQRNQDLQYVVMVVSTMAILSVYMVRPWNYYGNRSEHWKTKRDRTFALWSGMETTESNHLLTVVLFMTAICFCAPAGVHHLFVPVSAAAFGYPSVCLIFGAPVLEVVPLRITIMGLLGVFAFLGAYRREKHERSQWMTKRSLREQDQSCRRTGASDRGPTCRDRGA